MNDKIIPNDYLDLDGPAEPPTPPNKQPSGKGATKAIIIILVLALIGGGGYYYWQQQQKKPYIPKTDLYSPPTPTPIATPEPTSSPTQSAEQELDTTPEPTPDPLPKLGESDSFIGTELSQLHEKLRELATPEEFARKFVRAVYNAYKGRVVQQYRPLDGPNTGMKGKKTGQKTRVKTKKGIVDTEVYLPRASDFERYKTHALISKAVPAEQISKVYIKYYPLLQQAYGELGEGPEQFHSVMLGALDNLLSTPDVSDEKLELIQTSIVFKFKDEQLESLPATQKLLLRMGEENRSAIKNAVQALHNTLETFKPSNDA